MRLKSKVRATHGRRARSKPNSLICSLYGLCYEMKTARAVIKRKAQVGILWGTRALSALAMEGGLHVGLGIEGEECSC